MKRLLIITALLCACLFAAAPVAVAAESPWYETVWEKTKDITCGAAEKIHNFCDSLPEYKRRLTSLWTSFCVGCHAAWTFFCDGCAAAWNWCAESWQTLRAWYQDAKTLCIEGWRTFSQWCQSIWNRIFSKDEPPTARHATTMLLSAPPASQNVKERTDVGLAPSLRAVVAELPLDCERGFCVYSVPYPLFDGAAGEEVTLGKPFYDDKAFYWQTSLDESRAIHTDLSENDLLLAPQALAEELHKLLKSGTLDKPDDETLSVLLPDWPSRAAHVREHILSASVPSKPLKALELEKVLAAIELKLQVAPTAHLLFVAGERDGCERLVFCSRDGSIVRKRFFLHDDRRTIGISALDAWWTARIVSGQTGERPRVTWDEPYHTVYCLLSAKLAEDLKDSSFEKTLQHFVTALIATIPWSP